MDDRLVLQSVGDRLKTVHDDISRLTGQAFAGGKVDLATLLYEAGVHVDAAIDVLEVRA